MFGTVDLSRSARLVAGLLDGYRERDDPTIADGDEMYRGDLDSYLSVGFSATAQIANAMILTGRTDLPRILDLPCGHGRVTRCLRAVFPESEIVGCDLLRDGVEFCARQYGAVPVHSVVEPEEIPLPGEFDLIWVGSLLTHLDEDHCRRFMAVFRRHLAPGGLLLVSSHGRNAVNRWPASDERAQAIRADFERTGFGYRDHAGVTGYGTSAFTAAWMADEATRHDDVTMIGYFERGLADHQDLAVLTKLDVHHGQNAFILE